VVKLKTALYTNNESLSIPDHAMIIATGKDVDDFLRKVSDSAIILHLNQYGLEFSDDPSSPEAIRGSFDLLKIKMMNSLMNDKEVFINGQGLRDDQINHLRKVALTAGVPAIRVDLPLNAPHPYFMRIPSITDRKEETGPFDIIGDIHGCFDETLNLLEALGYIIICYELDDELHFIVSHAQSRRVVFVGDFIDRGPYPVEVLKLVMDMCEQGQALSVVGNHDNKLRKYLSGQKVSETHGFGLTRNIIDQTPIEFRQKVLNFLSNLPSHLLLNNGDLVVTHAGCEERMHGKDSAKITSFCQYGLVTGEINEDNLPIRGDWAVDYYGKALVVHGHVPENEPMWNSQGNVVRIDTACAFGRQLTALRWPEIEFVSVPANAVYVQRVDIHPLASIEYDSPKGGPAI
jgi:Calcineurin-like phosphoesterase